MYRASFIVFITANKCTIIYIYMRLYPKYSGLVPPSIQQLWQRQAPVPTGQTVNSGFYCDVLRRLCENVRRRRPELWREQTWLLHHDIAPSHTFLTQQFLAKNKMAVIPHPPYSPDLVPCNFLLFPKMKLKLKGRRFDYH
jgi:hypothetical protein